MELKIEVFDKTLKRLGKRLCDLAEASEISPATLSQIRRGYLKPGPNRIEKIQIGFAKLGLSKAEVEGLVDIKELPLEKFWRDSKNGKI